MLGIVSVPTSGGGVSIPVPWGGASSVSVGEGWIVFGVFCGVFFVLPALFLLPGIFFWPLVAAAGLALACFGWAVGQGIVVGALLGLIKAKLGLKNRTLESALSGALSDNPLAEIPLNIVAGGVAGLVCGILPPVVLWVLSVGAGGSPPPPPPAYMPFVVILGGTSGGAFGMLQAAYAAEGALEGGVQGAAEGWAGDVVERWAGRKLGRREVLALFDEMIGPYPDKHDVESKSILREKLEKLDESRLEQELDGLRLEDGAGVHRIRMFLSDIRGSHKGRLRRRGLLAAMERPWWYSGALKEGAVTGALVGLVTAFF